MAAGKVILSPVESDGNIDAIRTFRKTLQTSMGPGGLLKVFVTEGGYQQVTSDSSTLLQRLELRNPICRYISHVAGGLPDCGLYFGVMVSHLVEQLWSCDNIGKQRLMSIITSITQEVQKLLSCEQVCRSVNFSSIQSLLPLVKTVISSKSASARPDIDNESFCIEILKVFLNAIDNETGSVGRIYVKVDQGPSSCSGHNGLLYQVTEDHDLNILKQIKFGCKILVFTLKLENNLESNSISVVSQTISVLEQAIKANVKIIACQKMVSTEIKLYLLRRRVLLLERMGTDFTSALVAMSQACPVCRLSFDLREVETMLGNVTSVQHVEFNDLDYALIQNGQAAIGTLLIHNYSLTGTEHLKVLAQQALGALRSVATHPVLTLGGGCLETWLMAQINLLKDVHRDYRSVAHWVQVSLLSACGPQPPAAIDSVFHHGWDNSNRCRCGLVTAASLDCVEGRLIAVCELTTPLGTVTLTSPAQPSLSTELDLLVDCHQQKVNVIISALETFVNLSDIGLIVYKD